MPQRVITQELLQQLRAGFRTDFQAGIATAPSKYKLLATIVNSTAGLETYGWLGRFPVMRKWIGERRINTLEERAYQLKNEPYEASIAIHRDEIADDRLGIYPPLIRGWGQEAEDLKDRLSFEALGKGHLRPCFDNQNFFDTEHLVKPGQSASNIDETGAVQPWFLMDLSKPLKPIIYQNREEAHFDMITDPKSEHVWKTGEYLAGGHARGAAGYTMWQLARMETRTLNAANYQAAKLAMQSLVDEEGEPLAIRPTHIVVGVSNVAAAKDLFTKANLVGGESNVLLNDVQIIEAERLA